MEKSSVKFYRCDSCGKLYPETLVKEIEFSYNTQRAGAKEKLTTETMHGLICMECGKTQPVNLDTSGPDVPAPKEAISETKGKSTVTKKIYGRK